MDTSESLNWFMGAGLEELHQVFYETESRSMKADLRCGLED